MRINTLPERKSEAEVVQIGAEEGVFYGNGFVVARVKATSERDRSAKTKGAPFKATGGMRVSCNKKFDTTPPDQGSRDIIKGSLDKVVRQVRVDTPPVEWNGGTR